MRAQPLNTKSFYYGLRNSQLVLVQEQMHQNLPCLHFVLTTTAQFSKLSYIFAQILKTTIKCIPCTKGLTLFIKVLDMEMKEIRGFPEKQYNISTVKLRKVFSQRGSTLGSTFFKKSRLTYFFILTISLIVNLMLWWVWWAL